MSKYSFTGMLPGSTVKHKMLQRQSISESKARCYPNDESSRWNPVPQVHCLHTSLPTKQMGNNPSHRVQHSSQQNHQS
jgi:hypothetical protein